ncbi:MAG: GIY-YIG nuclease family protein [Thermoplasmata archaeon]|nr:MAG: GIY-YIG nuclease family protein [Thermoplasmata archaeon]MCD6170963.1 GIY-YIG nuclease family protein [Thermoplasmata archaeon]
MKGSYILIAEIDKPKRIKIGKLGEIYFKKGYYAYVGSALNSLEKRIGRHIRKEKKIRWHIDYLLQHASIKKIFYKEGDEREECMIASKFDLNYIPKFGSSDCNCKSHLFYSKNMVSIEKIIKKIGMKEWVKN